MNILVTGGAGYIGSHTCKALSRAGYTPITLDTLERGHLWAVKWGPFYKGSVHDRNLVQKILKKENIGAVFHFAAYAYVGESVENPQKYFYNNSEGTKTLLEAIEEYGKVNSFIFSSSCVVYGEPKQMPITERTLEKPINPYGESKLEAEQYVKEFSKRTGKRSVILRYFNACGSDPDGEIGAVHNPETRVMPLMIQGALDPNYIFKFYGNDYNTKDGSCIRDYIHVSDLASAHVKAFEVAATQIQDCETFNLGTQQGISVWEILKAVEEATGVVVKYELVARRPGDPAELVANVEKALNFLDWRPQHSELREIIETAVQWYKKVRAHST